MSQLQSHRRAIALATGLIACSLSPVALGTVLQYTDYASWSGIPETSIIGVETFDGFTSGFQPSPVGGAAGSVSWNAAAAEGVYFVQVAGSQALSTLYSITPITLSFLAVGGVSGVGGNFFTTDIDSNFLPGAITILVTLNDSSTQSFTRTMASASDFWGFHTTTSGIASLTVSTASFFGDPFATVDNLTFMAGATPVPEPASLSLALIGLGLVRLLHGARNSVRRPGLPAH